ncbi:MAG TPA: hypothetical protein PKE12_01590 [Kiritimatiellia bacterium]|nr:hypothetical protein [Kiritimatiellia bacterium]
MPRKKIALSMNELLAELARRRKQLPALQKKAARLGKQLAAVNAQIEALGGGAAAPAKPGRKPGRPAAARKPVKRARNKASLSTALLGVLSKSEPMSVKAIIEAVRKSGYKTKSKNFSTIVYQTLAREKKSVEKAGRGLYKLKA